MAEGGEKGRGVYRWSGAAEKSGVGQFVFVWLVVNDHQPNHCNFFATRLLKKKFPECPVPREEGTECKK